MIDYDKLKEAMENLFLLRSKEARHISLKSTFSDMHNVVYSLTIGEKENHPLLYGEHHLTEYLKELTKPEPKYEEGQMLWFSDKGEIRSFIVKDISQNAETFEVVYFDNYEHFDPLHEDYCYPSLKKLIDAQLKYWQSLKDDDDLSHLKVCKKCGGRSANPTAMLGGNPNCDHAFEDEKSVTECQHENNGQVYAMCKCAKCGELY